MDEVGKRLRKTRRDQDLSQEALGQMAGVTYQALNRIERGRTCPRIETVAKLAKPLGVDVKWLAFGDDKDGEA